ncbi:D-tyrosyl-tRNA(Tyr) deacylase [candidate division KSB1 bacterium RBG_16_48_16]|nr:MAG: D-tyrosyl-tRNA(Tyr) deacylase [candidate division KSB1 bacterium RBG_16_48_16]
MRALIQRVSHARVLIDGKTVGRIDKGLVVLLGVASRDTADDVKYLAEKIVHLRIFEDAEGKMNLSALDINGEILAISQFTLYADCRRGRRPGFADAAKPEIAQPLYEGFVSALKAYPIKVETGGFGAQMMVEILNDGPVTIMLDSDEK